MKKKEDDTIGIAHHDLIQKAKHHVDAIFGHSQTLNKLHRDHKNEDHPHARKIWEKAFKASDVVHEAGNLNSPASRGAIKDLTEHVKNL